MALVLCALVGNDAQWQLPVTEAGGSTEGPERRHGPRVPGQAPRGRRRMEMPWCRPRPSSRDAAGGLLEVRLTPADTAALAAGEYAWGIQFADGARSALGVPGSVAGTGTFPGPCLGRGHGAGMSHATHAHLRRDRARWQPLRQSDEGPRPPAARGQLRRICSDPAPNTTGSTPAVAGAGSGVRSSMTGSASMAGPARAGVEHRTQPPACRSTTSSHWWLAVRPTTEPTCGRSVRAATPASRSMTATSGADAGGWGGIKTGVCLVSQREARCTRGRVSPNASLSPTGATGRPGGAMGSTVVRWAIRVRAGARPAWLHGPSYPVPLGELAADHPVPLVLGGEPLPARPDVLCSSCKRGRGSVSGGGEVGVDVHRC